MNDYFALVSCEISQDELAALEQTCTVIPLPSDEAVDAPVRSHPDMILCVIGSTLVTHRAYYEAHRAVIDRVAELGGLHVVTSDHPRGATYPLDVGFNAAVTRSHVICNAKATCPEILSAAREHGLEVLHVSQGYAACSCIVTDDVLITSDAGIHSACQGAGIKSCLVSNRGISLPVYDVGFIGGSGGYESHTLYFYGSISEMECERDIKSIADSHGYSIKCLSDKPLIDRGGIKFLKLAKR